MKESIVDVDPKSLVGQDGHHVVTHSDEPQHDWPFIQISHNMMARHNMNADPFT